MKILDLGANSGPHYIALTRDEKRLVISDYFLNEDDAGKVHAEGDHLCGVQLLPGEQLEQPLLLRIRRREAGLDHVHAECVQGAHHAQLLLGGEAHAAPAHAVAQGGVV